MLRSAIDNLIRRFVGTPKPVKTEIERVPMAVRSRAPASPITTPGDEGARRTIEALRFGLVPNEALGDLTINYPSWEQWILGRLPAQRGEAPTVSEVLGHFGTGKSHSMALIRQVAHERSYVTARVEVDGQSVTLANPESFLYGLWNSLRLPSGEPVDLIDLYLRAIKRSRIPPSMATLGKDRIRRNFEVVRELADRGRIDHARYAVNAVLSSSEEFTAVEVKNMLYGELGLPHPYCDIFRMVGKKLDGRPYDFLESLIGHTRIAKLAGFSGLVVTIDEFEVEAAVLVDKLKQREETLLRATKAYLKGNLWYPPVPLALFFATATVGRGPGDAFVDELIKECNGEYRRLETFQDGDYRVLASAISKIYARAYGCRLERLEDRIDVALGASVDRDNKTREFIRRFVFLLDAAYGPPHAKHP